MIGIAANIRGKTTKGFHVLAAKYDHQNHNTHNKRTCIDDIGIDQTMG